MLTSLKYRMAYLVNSASLWNMQEAENITLWSQWRQRTSLWQLMEANWWVFISHQRCLFDRHRMGSSDTRGSTLPQGSSSSHSSSAHHTGSHHTGPDRCHTRRSGMVPASRCPCWCTPGHPLCSSYHRLQQTEVGGHFHWLNSELWFLCGFLLFLLLNAAVLC